jgi:hypothetical protein
VILWRGQPDWYNRLPFGLGRTPALRSDVAAVPPETEPWYAPVRIEAGGESGVAGAYDLGQHTVRFLGRELTLGADNVLLVDRVDGAGGPPHIVGTARISATVPPAGPPLYAALDSALARSAAARDFLR